MSCHIFHEHIFAYHTRNRSLYIYIDSINIKQYHVQLYSPMRRQSRLEPVGGTFDGTFKVVTFWAANLHVTGRVMTCHEVSTKLTSSCRKKVAGASHNVSHTL